MVTPRRLRRAEINRWISKIPSARSRTITISKLEELLTTSSR
jgi:hypothetical protein